MSFLIESALHQNSFYVIFKKYQLGELQGLKVFPLPFAPGSILLQILSQTWLLEKGGQYSVFLLRTREFDMIRWQY
jgi:hypothetical protein